MDNLTQAVRWYNVASYMIAEGWEDETGYAMNEFMNVMRNDADEGLDQQ